MKNIIKTFVKYKKYIFLSPIIRFVYTFKKPSIAACVLFYNKIDQTLECLQSLLYSQVPIYILDNCSDKKQRKLLDEFVSKYAQITVFNSSENLGVAKGRNYLIKKTKEQWLFFLDNDITIVEKKWLISFNQNLYNNKSADIFIPKLFNKHENLYVAHPRMVIEKDIVKLTRRDEGVSNMFPGGAAIISRKYFNKIGIYDEKMFVGFEDFEIAIRAIELNIKTNAIIVNNIELVHDHRYSNNIADKNSTKVRYDEERISKSEERIMELYNLKIFGNWRKWVKEQNKKIVMKNAGIQ